MADIVGFFIIRYYRNPICFGAAATTVAFMVVYRYDRAFQRMYIDSSYNGGIP